MKAAVKRYLISQFGNPRGAVGALAGLVMRGRSSNQRRNLWTLDLMQIADKDRILEVGFGPGYALEHLLRRHSDIEVVGIDRSRTMYRMARKRNRSALRSARLELTVGSVESLELLEQPCLEGPFNRIYSINTVMFWQHPVATFAALRGRLAVDGHVYVTYQPRTGERTDTAALAAADSIRGRMRQAGFGSIDVAVCSDLSPVAVCLIGGAGHAEPIAR